MDIHSSDPIRVTVSVYGQKLDMEVDTGAAYSVISEVIKQTLFENKALQSSSLVLKTYTNECMNVQGTFNVKIQYPARPRN